jgi:hypothetical protein
VLLPEEGGFPLGELVSRIVDKKTAFNFPRPVPIGHCCLSFCEALACFYVPAAAFLSCSTLGSLPRSRKIFYFFEKGRDWGTSVPSRGSPSSQSIPICTLPPSQLPNPTARSPALRRIRRTPPSRKPSNRYGCWVQEGARDFDFFSHSEKRRPLMPRSTVLPTR